MATIVLTAVGSALGGPIGGALGALAGQAIDAQIFKAPGRSGPRLNDLQVQTSRYGTRVPRLYGAIRVAGTVIWSTDLQESSASNGGGKGQPSVTSYSYSASFAVALSARAITGIGRIWADGNLLRGAAGDFKSPVGAFRLHKGNGDQLVDPLIAADVGPDHCPAFRGCAYVVFDGLALADFGNRIPSLTFEVFADAGPVGVAAIASDLAGRSISYVGDGEEPNFTGFAGDGADLRDALAPLIDAHDLLWREADGLLALTGGKAGDIAIDPADDIQAIDGKAEPAATRQRLPIEVVPIQLSIRHHDPERDFQAGVQTAERPGAGVRTETIDLPAALSAGQARQFADRKLRTALRRRAVERHPAGWAALALDVGDVIEIAGTPGRWLVQEREWDDMAIRLTVCGHDGSARLVMPASDSGAPVRQADAVQGPTSLAIVELPADGDALATAPLVHAAATGADAGWRRAALFRYRPDPDGVEPIGRTAPRAVLGTTVDVLPDGPPWRIDRRGSLEVVLDTEGDALTSRDDGMLLQGANLCLVGEEVLQFGIAEPLGPKRYRLSHFIRGWHGTEWATGGHAAGERFVLIDPARLAPVALSSADIGQRLVARAIGSGDLVPAEAARPIDGRAMLPLSPVHGRIVRREGEGLAASWIRRSRIGWGWADGNDAPLGEEREAYAVRVVAEGVVLRTWEIAGPSLLYPVADHVADTFTAGPSPLRLEIRQIGTMGLGRPLVLALP